MREVIGEVLPLAVVVMVSPINIVAAILLLFSSRPIGGATAYLLGFAAGVGAVVVGLDLLVERADWSDGSETSLAAAIVRIVLGLVLLVAAVRKLRARSGAPANDELPRWMEGIAALPPAKAAASGFAVGALNPKNLAMALAASLAVGAAELSSGETAVVTLVYVVVASLGVAAPLVVTLLLGDRSRGVLESWRTWLVRNNGVVMAVVYLVFAAVLIGNGIAKL